ncbi:MAG: IS3 family transposase [Candidatus Woesebacteria bacterium]|nr:IS3 family transposase [Candidatus Woesebacteria bacterium]
MGNVIKRKSLSKTALAEKLGISRSSLYYQHKRPVIDAEVKTQIESVLTNHPAYGHKRIAMELKLNHKRILRVMKKFGIKPYKRRAKKPWKKDDLGKPETGYANLIKEINPQDLKQNAVWVSDFTYLKYKDRFLYLATIMDLWDREIIGVNISRFHNKELILGAFEDGISKFAKPEILHSDQGSEYDSEKYLGLVEKLGIKVSMSAKGSPWQNGYQESFYSNFKLELGQTDRFETVGELIEEVYKQISYYNNRRMHSKLKMSPVQFRQKLLAKMKDTVSKELGT